MSQHRILQIGPVAPPVDEELRSLYDVSCLWLQKDKERFLAEEGASFTAVATHLRDAVSASLMDQLPNLKAIVNFGAGYDKIDRAAADRRGIQISNTPGVLDDAVADIAVGLMIDVARGLTAADRFVRAGGWKSGQRPLMTHVSRKRLGLFGFGGIGQAIAKRAAGFSMAMRYHSRHAVPGYQSAHVSTLLELAQWCDFLVVATVGGAATRHMVNREVMDAVGPEGIIVNIARGSVIDEEALVAALRAGTLGGAGLDVFENEPHPSEPLLAMDNVVLLSHIGGFTRESRQGMERLMLDNMKAFHETSRVLTPVA